MPMRKASEAHYEIKALCRCEASSQGDPFFEALPFYMNSQQTKRGGKQYNL